eukprot:4234178-Pyramimonas_sp.AAC.1
MVNSILGCDWLSSTFQISKAQKLRSSEAEVKRERASYFELSAASAFVISFRLSSGDTSGPQ